MAKNRPYDPERAAREKAREARRARSVAATKAKASQLAPKPKPATESLDAYQLRLRKSLNPKGVRAPKAKVEESVQQAAPDPVKRADAVERARMESFAQYLSTLKQEQAADPTEAARVARQKAATAEAATGRGKRSKELAAMRAAQKAARAAGATEDEIFARRQLEDYRKRTGIDLLPKKAPKSSKASSHKPKQPKSVTGGGGRVPGASVPGGSYKPGRSIGEVAADKHLAEQRAKKQSGKKRDLVMTPKQIKRRAERARKKGGG